MIILVCEVFASIDDGLASGYSMLAAVRFVRKQRPRGLCVALPVAADAAATLLAAEPGIGHRIFLTRGAQPVFRLAAFYKEFQALTDDDAVRRLEEAKAG